jgi:hypothetical protein
MGFVYLLKSDINGFVTYKIGKTSRKPSDRLMELSTGNAGDMKIIYSYYTKNYNQLEKMLQAHFRIHSINREWFNDNLDENEFIRSCKEWDDRISFLKKMENPFI